MYRRAWRYDAGKDDLMVEGPVDRVPGSERSSEDGRSSTDIGLGEGDSRSGASGYRGWRGWLSRLGPAVWAGFFGGSRIPFEEAFHRFAGELDQAGSSAHVETGLLRLAREFVPGSRITLIRVWNEDTHSKDAGPERAEAIDGPGRAMPSWFQQDDESVAMIPLRYGVAIHGQLRLLTPRRSYWCLRPSTLRRLKTACTMAACALENLRWHTGSAFPGGDEPPTDERSRHERHRPPAVIRDATFLNAVLPFAVDQSKRHREPVSLLCLAVDRLSAIQDLMGLEAADRLVEQVCRVVASSIRSSDIVARLDDDRIIVLLVRARGQSALRIAQIITRSVADMTRDADELAYATVSIGVAEFPSDADNAHSLIDVADEALARAQSQGPAQVATAPARPILVASSVAALEPAACPD